MDDDTAAESQVATVHLKLYVENNNKFVRGKKKSREWIERFCLAAYNARPCSDHSADYVLTIPYSHRSELDECMGDLIYEIHSTAELRHCWVECSAHERELDVWWD